MRIVPNKTFQDLKKELPSLEKTLFVGTSALLLVAFSVLFVANPGITGYAVVEPMVDQTSRFNETSSLLFLIFGGFAFFLFVITKKAKQKL